MADDSHAAAAYGMDSEPEFCSCNISLVLRRKMKLQEAGREFVGLRLQGSTFFSFVRTLQRAFPSSAGTIEEQVLSDSIRDLAGTVLSLQQLKDTAWRLAGNVDRLKNCIPVPLWGSQAVPEWTPVQVVYVDLAWPAKTGYRLGAVFRLRFLAGTPCPLLVTRTWSNSFCAVLGRKIGFTAPWNKCPYADPRQLFGFRFYVKVAPEYCNSHGPGFHEIRAASGAISWNKRLLKMRYRTDRDFFDCPHGYPPEFACHKCHFGTEDCPAATHERTYIKQHCPRCSSTGWFDPAGRRKFCISCTYAHRRGRK